MAFYSVKSKWILFLFGMVLLIDLIGIIRETETVHFIAKLLLMPLLIAFLFSSLPAANLSRIKPVIAGLSLAWFGDLFLLLEDKQPIFFIIGLLFFLATHVCYIIFFRRLIKEKKTGGPHLYIQTFLVILYGAGLVAFLYPHLNEMKIPVIIYAICITTMFFYSLRLKNVLAFESWKWLVTGAALFVLSDSILAIHKFYIPFSAGPVLIMLTYGLAQCAISLGSSKLFDKNHDTGIAPVE